MARFVLKWRYIKSGQDTHHSNLVKYIATRDGVELNNSAWKNQPATVEQQRFISKLIKDYPDSVESLEYQDYLSTQTKYNASEFINRTIDENVDLIGKKSNYVEYIAKRPRVEKMGQHGLFSQTDEPINLREVSKTVAKHQGIVWTTVLSLTREDAINLGFDNAKAWRVMLRSNADALANAMKIPLTDLRWYAAFHNEGNHPHVHLISYSVGKEPYMNEEGLKKLKASYVKEIFKSELHNIFENQTEARNELRQAGQETISSIVEKINRGDYENKNVELLLREAVKELQNYSGKMVYGYLPKKVKNLIDGVVDELEKDKRITLLYDAWYKQRENIVSIYQNVPSERIPLSRNNDFKPIRNAVVRELKNLKEVSISEQVFERESDETVSKETEKPTKDITIRTHRPVQHHSPYHNSNTPQLALASIRLFASLVQIFKDNEQQRDIERTVDRKIMRKNQEKKAAHGLKMSD